MKIFACEMRNGPQWKGRYGEWLKIGLIQWEWNTNIMEIPSMSWRTWNKIKSYHEYAIALNLFLVRESVPLFFFRSRVLVFGSLHGSENLRPAAVTIFVDGPRVCVVIPYIWTRSRIVRSGIVSGIRVRLGEGGPNNNRTRKMRPWGRAYPRTMPRTAGHPSNDRVVYRDVMTVSCRHVVSCRVVTDPSVTTQ
jgi:hypothetical protein